jgi:hypothetical protein
MKILKYNYRIQEYRLKQSNYHPFAYSWAWVNMFGDYYSREQGRQALVGFRTMFPQKSYRLVQIIERVIH